MATDRFPTDPTGLAEASRPELLAIGHASTVRLTIAPVAKRLGDTTVRMLGYNGSVPGPTLQVAEGSEITVELRNEGDLETTLHWHGLRLANEYDGVPHETQAPVPVGAEYTYRLRFPDPGLYWYHPHIREDYTQELGLYGNILVVPASADYWPAVDREFVLTVDDLLVEDGRIAPFSPHEVSYAAMGRYGNVFLTSGEPDLRLTAAAGEVVRLWLTNTANTRVFRLTVPGVRLKLVGGDSGRVERESFVEDVLIAPSERFVVDVLFADEGEYVLTHNTPDQTYPLAVFDVRSGTSTGAASSYETLREAPELVAERNGLSHWLEAAPDKSLGLVAVMDDPAAVDGETSVYVCPMHPEVTSTEPARCPKCGMKLLAGSSASSSADHGEMHSHSHDMGGGHSGGGDGIEWEDDMVEVNRGTTEATMHWQFVDRTEGAGEGPIDWRFKVGERVKIRLLNEMDSDHPMQHPFHLHGAGRFLVLARDGVTEPNLVWKDTVLVRTGQTVDILFDITNPGLWMAHCHIAEHMQSGMMFSFVVTSD